MEEILLKSATLDDKHRAKVRYYGDLTRGKPSEAEQAIASQIFRVLARSFPGHPWSVEIDGAGGWAKIGIIELLGPNWGMVLHLDNWNDDLVRRLAGELLERFRIPRSTIDVAYYMSAKANIPMLGNFRGKDRHRIPG